MIPALRMIAAEERRHSDAALGIRATALEGLGPSCKAEVFASAERWLEARSQGEHPIGGSTIPAILGLSPYSGPWDVWLERLHPQAAKGRSINPSDARRGHALEPGILAWLEAELHAEGDTGARVVHIDPALVSRADEPWMRCSPDGLILRPDAAPALVEVKTCRAYRDEADWPAQAADWREPGLPRPDWVVQTQWNMAVTGCPVGLLLIVGTTQTLRRVAVTASPELREELRTLAADWRDAHLLWGAEPDREASDACVRWVQQQMATRTFGAHPPARLDAEEAAPIRAWVDAQRAATEAKAAADAAKPGAVLAMEAHPHGAIIPAEGDQPAARVVWQTRGKSSFIRSYDHHENEEAP